MAVDDGVADTAAAAHVNVIEEDALVDFAIAVDADVEAEDGFGDAAAGDDGTGADDGVERGAGAFGVGENEFGRRILLLPGIERPAFVVEVEDRGHGNEIHVGFVVGVDGADIAPVGFFFFIFVAKIVGVDAVLIDQARNDVLAKIVFGVGVFGVSDQSGEQHLGIE